MSNALHDFTDHGCDLKSGIKERTFIISVILTNALPDLVIAIGSFRSQCGEQCHLSSTSYVVSRAFPLLAELSCCG